jgi:hypothetical protein
MKHRAPVAADLAVAGVPVVLEGRHALRKQGTVEPPGAPEEPPSEKWRTVSHLRTTLFLLLVPAAVAAGLAGRLFVDARTNDHVRYLVLAALLVAGLWAVLTATAPQVVTLRGSHLTVKSRGGTDRFDLADGMQVLELHGDPNSSKWSLVLYRPDGSAVHLRRRDVDASTLDPLVRKFRQIAERRRAERWTRLGL